MEFKKPLTEAILLRRYKRFLADVAVSKTDRRTIYCPNMGALRGCNILGSRVWFSSVTQMNSKYPDTWELVEVDGGHFVYINVQQSNNLVFEALEQNMIDSLDDGDVVIERDVSLPMCHNRFDFKLHYENKPTCYMSVKAVTLGDEIHRGFFPDGFDEQSSRLLKDLIQIKKSGHRAILFFCVQHTGIKRVFPADHLDGRFGKVLREAYRAGVEVMAFKINVQDNTIQLNEQVEVCIPDKIYGTSLHDE